MWKPIYQPEPWPQFVKRKDIKGLPLMEQRKKFLQEQILFENYLSTLNTVNTVSTAAAGAAGGPAPVKSPPTPVIQVLINTNFKPTGSVWNGAPGAGSYINDVPSTRVFLDTYAPEYANSTTDPDNDFGDPLYYKGDREFTVDWGDGTTETLTEWGVTLNPGFGGRTNLYSHDYATDGEYTITITGEGAAWGQFAFLPIVDILKFDNIIGKKYADNRGVGVFAPTTATGPSLRGLFAYTFWDGYTSTPTVDITQLDVSSVVDFVGTFLGSDNQWFRILARDAAAGPDLFSFNEDISGWDVSNAEAMVQMFQGQGYFDQNLGSWDTSKVKNFYLMFRDCTRLMSGSRADLWDVSSVEPGSYTFVGNFARMFEGSMTDMSVVGSMPHIGNWTFDSISDGTSNFMDYAFANSGFSHTAIGQSLIGWASQSALPVNIGVSANAFANTFNGTYQIGGGPNFSNPSYDTGSAFGLEVSASYAFLTGTAADGSTTTLTVQASTGKGDTERYFINGVELNNPSLIDDFTFLIGNTYRFDQSDASNAGHPLRFSTTIDGIHGGGNEYVTGVTIVGTPGTSGSYSEITVTENTASPLYVYCPNHAGYGLGYLGANPQPLTMNQGGKGWTIPGFTFD